ncbi:hypothetical protein MYP_1968 [Sporocytophaga myxococcoides]|uniref:Uncharacterized protein n=1 Tax=Sporocytophaga myxococcoides TaxID=153721 RepID=A0A098LCX7_9BACT|nr:hypothetical protein MYP_1968 [Sporocytophaga myxococcoides]
MPGSLYVETNRLIGLHNSAFWIETNYSKKCYACIPFSNKTKSFNKSFFSPLNAFNFAKK